MMGLLMGHGLLAFRPMAHSGLPQVLMLGVLKIFKNQKIHQKDNHPWKLQMYNNSSAVRFQAIILVNGSTVMISQTKFSNFASTMETVTINVKTHKVVGNIPFTTKLTALPMGHSLQVLRLMDSLKHLQAPL